MCTCKDPLTGRELRFRKTRKTEVEAQIELGRLLEPRQDRYLAIDPVTCGLIQEHLAAVAAALADIGVKLSPSAYLFSNHPANTQPWNPDWASHRVADLAAAAGVQFNIKALRHYTASQLLA